MNRTLLALSLFLLSSSALAASPQQCSGFDGATLHRGQLWIDVAALDEAADLLSLDAAALVNDIVLSESAKPSGTIVRATAARKALEMAFAVHSRPGKYFTPPPSPTEAALEGVMAARDEVSEVADEAHLHLTLVGTMSRDAKLRLEQERAVLDDLLRQVDEGAGPLSKKSSLARQLRQSFFRLGRLQQALERLGELASELQDEVELADAALDPLDALACTLAP